MTFGDRDSIDEDVLSALRADAQGGVPQGSRDRVLRRLGLGAGVLGATASVSTGAGALVAGALATHSTAVLVSTLAIGVGIGFGAHSGLDVLRSPKEPVAATAVAQPRAPASLTPPSSRPTTLPVQPATPAPEPPPTTASTGERTRERASHSAPSTPPPPLVPTPVLAPPGLAAQQSLLDDARSSLVRGDGTSALSAVGAHRLRFPDTSLGEERAAIEIRALIALGRIEEARERHGAFERAFPGSLFIPSLRTLVPGAAAESVTEPPASPQVME
jgi:resuscitation-promoting factor RpfA